MKKYVWLGSILAVLLSASLAFGAWNSAKPAPGDIMSDSQADILANFQAIDGTSGALPSIDVIAVGTVDALDITQASTAQCIDINKTGVGAGTVIDIENDGTGVGLYINQDGVLATGQHALEVESTVAQVNAPFIEFALSNSSSDQQVLYIANAGTGPALYIDNQTESDTYGVAIVSNADQDTGPLVYINQDNAGSSKSGLHVKNDGTEGSAQLESTNAAGCPLKFVLQSSSSYATEGGVYADTEDGVLSYRSSAAWAPMNTDADYAETFGIVGDISDYQEGTVVVISDEEVTQDKKDKIKDKSKVKVYDGENPQGKPKYKIVHSDRKEIRLMATALKVEKSSAQYQTNIVGIVCFRTYKNWVIEDTAPIALMGKVPCYVNNQNGFIKAGDLLTTSSQPGVAMKATIDSFDKIGSIIGKAREDFNGVFGKIEILVGIK